MNINSFDSIDVNEMPDVAACCGVIVARPGNTRHVIVEFQVNAVNKQTDTRCESIDRSKCNNSL